MLTLTRLAATLRTELFWTWMHDLPAYQAGRAASRPAFEIAEQLGWDATPELRLHAHRHGHQSLRDLEGLRRAPTPRIHGSRAARRISGTAGRRRPAGPSPRAWGRGHVPARRVPPNVRAPHGPRRVTGYHAHDAVRRSPGTAITVTDAEIRQALLDIGGREGIYCEPASGRRPGRRAEGRRDGSPRCREARRVHSHEPRSQGRPPCWFGVPVSVERDAGGMQQAAAADPAHWPSCTFARTRGRTPPEARPRRGPGRGTARRTFSPDPAALDPSRIRSARARPTEAEMERPPTLQAEAM